VAVRRDYSPTTVLDIRESGERIKEDRLLFSED
jgi:hypothetical protein